jgi:hypothetical protein
MFMNGSDLVEVVQAEVLPITGNPYCNRQWLQDLKVGEANTTHGEYGIDSENDKAS